MTPAPNTCPTCGTSLDAARTGDVCAACLLLGAVDESPGGGSLGTIAGHALIEVIARGGMGIVYRARQSDPVREVALKALPGAELMSEEARQRFRIEGQAMAKLDHPAIVPVYEVGEEDGTPFFTMKFATGGTLSRRIGEYAGKWREIAELMARIAEAVQFAHSHGVLHRDLKPGNILFDESGQAFVGDFGLAKLVGTDSDLTRTIAMMGTPSYMAPEMARKNGGITTACDVWSLGVILYELLSGHPPFQGENIPAVLRAVAEDEPTALSGTGVPPAEAGHERDARDTCRPEARATSRIPRDLGVITFKALQKDPERRYGTAQEFAVDLRRWLRGEAINARSQPLSEQCWRWLRRHPIWAAGLLLALGGISLLFSRQTMLARINRETAAKNAELRQGLSDALAEQAAGKRSDDLFTRRADLTSLLQKAAGLAPSFRARSVAASMLALPHAYEVQSRITYREAINRGEVIRVTADLKRRLTYRRVSEKSTKRLIEITALDAAVNDAPADWRLQLPGASSIYADLSDDGSRVVFANGEKTELWDTSANRQIGVVDPHAPTEPVVGKLWLVDLHPTQPLLVWLDRGGAMWTWRFPEGEQRRIGKPAAPVLGLVLSPSGEQVATSSGGGVEVWGTDEAAAPSFIACAGASDALAWSHHGLLVGHLRLPEVAVIRDGMIACTFRAGGARVTRLESLPGTWLALAVSEDNQSWLWDTRDGTPELRIGAGQTVLKAGEDGRRFVISRVNTVMAVFEVAREPAFREYDCPHDFSDGRYSTIGVSSDGRLLMTLTQGRVVFWDRAKSRMVAEWPLTSTSGGISAALAPDGSAVFASQSEGKGIYRRTIAWKADALELGTPELLPNTAGLRVQQIATSGTRYLLAEKDEQSVWEGSAAGPLKKIESRDPKQRARSLSAGFKFGHASNMAYRKLPLFDGISSHVLHTVSEGDWAGRAMFTQDERWMMAYTRSYYRLFSTQDWQMRFETRADVPGNQYGDLALSPDSRLAALEHDTDTFGIFSLPDGRHLVDLEALPAGDVIGVNFTADGRAFLLLNRHHRLYEWNLDALQAELNAMGLGW